MLKFRVQIRVTNLQVRVQVLVPKCQVQVLMWLIRVLIVDAPYIDVFTVESLVESYDTDEWENVCVILLYRNMAG